MSKDWLIAWCHRRRFQMALYLAKEFTQKRILDYGCGDGTFLALVMKKEGLAPSLAVGAEATPDLVEDCRARLGSFTRMKFVLLDELDQPEHPGAYDGIFCMEVLEHVVEVEPLLDRFIRLLAPSGKLLISIPVEIGLPLLMKQAMRTIAGWRGLGDYPGISPYTLREYGLSIFAGPRQHIVRPQFRDANGNLFYDHKGFNWKVLRELLAKRFHIEGTLSSPLPWLPPSLNSQVWFLARKSLP